jgi:hypothetical protein
MCVDRQFVLAAVLAGGLLVGCEGRMDYESLGLVNVTGRVTMDGRPLSGVTVRFEGPPNRFADGKTDSDGKYVLMYDSNQAGCLPGEKVVRIMQGGVGEGSDEATPVEGPDGRAAAATQTIPASYNRQSTLNANVSADNKMFDFDLKSSP